MPVLDRTASGLEFVRYAPHAPQVRAADEASDDAPEGVLFGHFSVFNRWYEINSAWEGNFLERVAPGAFEETFRDDVQRCWFEHGYSATLDRHSLGSIEQLREDSVGAYYEVRLFDGLPEFFTEGLRAGEYGASFRFRVLKESIDNDPGESAHNERGIPEVTIERAQVIEFGPVSIGASPHATANLRCGTDQFYDLMRSRDAEAFDRARQARDLNSSDVEPASSGAGGDGEDHPDTGRSRSAAALAALHVLQGGDK